MNEEIEAIKGALDVLIARSLAQEVVLVYLSQLAADKEFLFELDLHRVTAAMTHRHAHSSLTDAQLVMLESELQRMRHLISTVPPADELPY